MEPYTDSDSDSDASSVSEPESVPLTNITNMNSYDYATHLIQKWVEKRKPNNILSLRNISLTILPPIPEGVKRLDVSENKLRRIRSSALPSTLVELYCSYNYLCKLPNELPKHLQILICNHNKLTAIPDNLPTTLTTLSAVQNFIQTLPSTMPDSIEYIDVSENCIHTIEKFPESMYNCVCINNKIRQLPPFPHNLITLNCSNNEIIVFPDIPQSLQFLRCDYNQLVELPDENSLRTLTVLTCMYNNFPKGMEQRPEYIEGIEEYKKRWATWWKVGRMRRTQTHVATFKEELIQKTWHPTRFTKWCLDVMEMAEW